MDASDGLLVLSLDVLARQSIAELVACGRAAIEMAGSFGEVKAIADRAEALRHYLRSVGAAVEAVNAAAEIRIRAERRAGEELAASERAPAGRPEIGRADRPISEPPTLAEIGISKDQSARYQRVAAISLDTFEAIIEAHKAVEEPLTSASLARIAEGLGALPEGTRQLLVLRDEAALMLAARRLRGIRTAERRTERMHDLAVIAQANAELGLGRRYPVIYADPPWRYEHAESESRAIENQYPTMSHEELCELPVGDLATNDAIIFLWATAPKLAESLALLDAWGFNYRTCAVWDKQHIGMGYYFRVQHELLLIATRGEIPAPAPADRPPSVISSPRAAHSRKPAEFRDIIERFYPGLPRIELFCREAPEGWDTWGNQSGGPAAV
jgi:N6-adenosine-specific RNA methylase IME4/stage V sporulation protein SpoVS